MGSGASSQQPTASRSLTSTSSLVSRFLSRRKGIDPSNLPDSQLTWILMGEPCSGRRTLAKHLQLLFTYQCEDDLEEANKKMIPQIMAMVTQQLQILSFVAERELEYEFGDFSLGSEYDIRTDLEILQQMSLDKPWSRDDAERITRLWATAAMQGAYCDRGVVNSSDDVILGCARPLDESLAYFCHPNKVNDLMTPSFIPSFQDYLQFPQQHNLQGVKDHLLTAGSGDNTTTIRLTTLLNTPTQKWMSSIENGSLICFCVALPCLPLSVKSNRINPCDYNRLKTARSLFASIINMAILKQSPIVLIFTKADLCVLENPDDVRELICSFTNLSKREMSVRVLLSDGMKERRVRSLFVGLMRATIELGMQRVEHS
jgi:hypothetical protein